MKRIANDIWGFRAMRTRVAFLLTFTLLGGALTNRLDAQLPQDVRDVFEGMMDSLEDDLKEKFQKAIDDDTDKVEFTAEEFLRFRVNPANPFEGLDRIDIKKGGGNVALKFELPSMRNRKIASLERQHASMLVPLKGPTKSVGPSVVRVYSGTRHVAMGLIVMEDGHVLTKASEVNVRDNLRCEFSDGRTFDATLVKANEENDLAILKIQAKGLATIQWSEEEPKLGAFLLTPDRDGSVIALGTYSVRPRSTNVGEQAFLGVQPVTADDGVVLRDIQPGAASYAAGLRDGDVLFQLQDQSISDVAGLVKAIRERRPGDKVKIDFRRNGVVMSTIATLGGNKVSGERAARFKMMNRLGAVPSRREGNFPVVFQHDSPLFPEHCGGPILDLEGNLVGINIARSGRASTLAIPSDHARMVVEKMLSESVAEAK